MLKVEQFQETTRMLMFQKIFLKKLKIDLTNGFWSNVYFFKKLIKLDIFQENKENLIIQH